MNDTPKPGTATPPAGTAQTQAQPGAAAAAGGAAGAETTNVVALDAARGEGEARALAYVNEVNEICALAGCPDKAADFIGKKLAAADVRRALMKAQAAEADATAITGNRAAGHGGGKKAPTGRAAIDYAAIYGRMNNPGQKSA